MTLISAGTITVGGLTALLEAMLASTPFSASVVQLSSDVMACTGLETALTNVVYQAPAAIVSQSIQNVNSIRTTLTMDTTIGNFSIGTMGLLTATGTLFALATFPGAGMKLADNLPSLAGNIRTFLMDIGFIDITSGLTPITGSIAPVTLPIALRYANGAVTARQFRTALSQAGFLTLVTSAVASSDANAQSTIDWDTCAPVYPNSPILNLTIASLSLTDEGAALLAAAALLLA